MNFPEMVKYVRGLQKGDDYDHAGVMVALIREVYRLRRKVLAIERKLLSKENSNG